MSKDFYQMADRLHKELYTEPLFSVICASEMQRIAYKVDTNNPLSYSGAVWEGVTVYTKLMTEHRRVVRGE